ncbi:hypothetical protein BCV72DRAFT_335841 [Rhizopus microsporus var. microsporus]|uniref:Uncharacterized protein n=2 Tax=Rhizopus microsporus TaxID=58291 RepID=A0A2G4T9S8_RHIZD|nr:uncharacterized protein RHIMIDRAFT_288585 [Rhizopus microsporus ATCC 52813]ORE06545.1 hypothetical protein BCV72DRAFT_335841 [Rhizopus microsporus var. microsporus]PHZ17770.1 hypothetical protein RHIMIDRAFT_288585 [Rhizopus microsporus ATCC 52813]
MQFNLNTISAALNCTERLHEEVKPIQLAQTNTATVFSSPPTESLLKELTNDFRFTPSLLHAGAFVVANDEVLVLLACKVYGGFKSADIHNDNPMKSTPSFCEKIFVEIYEEFDGVEIKKMLKIGAKYMDILVTMSTGLTTENIERFKETMAQGAEYCPPQDLNALCQLVSGFGDLSTY